MLLVGVFKGQVLPDGSYLLKLAHIPVPYEVQLLGRYKL